MRFAVLTFLAVASLVSAKPTERSICISASGDETARCLDAYLDAGSATPAFTESAVRDHCSEDTTYAIGGFGLDDLVEVLRNACTDFGAELHEVLVEPRG